MRFGLGHLFAVTTLFAVLVAIGIASDAIERDGIWVVESIDAEHWGGTWHGEDAATGEPTGGAVQMYVATLRDGDRVRSACFGDDMETRRSQLPRAGDCFVFTGAEMPRGKAISPGSTIFTGPPPGRTYFAIDDHTLVLPAQRNDGYSPKLNALAALVTSVLVVFSFALTRRFVVWLPKPITAHRERKQAMLEYRRRTRII